MNPKEFQERLKPMMRAQELQRRAARTAVMRNHIELTNDMTPEEKEEFRTKLVPDTRGYWKRLWDAIRGKS